MAIITLTTDWGLKDYYVSIVKGGILSQYPEAVIVDISHQIPPFDILQASFVLRNSYVYFPKGTVHIVGVNDSGSLPIVALIEGHFFIGSDNGIFSMISKEKPEVVVELQEHGNNDGAFSPFPSKEFYIRAASHLARGGAIKELGEVKEGYVERSFLRPVVEESAVRGSVIYIDAYENVVTNISRKLFDEARKDRLFTIYFRKFDYTIEDISSSYYDVPEGEKLALFNASGLLEIAINKHKAASLLGFKNNDTVRIEFHDNANS